MIFMVLLPPGFRTPFRLGTISSYILEAWSVLLHKFVVIGRGNILNIISTPAPCRFVDYSLWTYSVLIFIAVVVSPPAKSANKIKSKPPHSFICSVYRVSSLPPSTNYTVLPLSRWDTFSVHNEHIPIRSPLENSHSHDRFTNIEM